MGDEITVTVGEKTYTISVQQSSRWDDTTRASVPHPYLTCWIMRGWPDLDEARRMYRDGTWAKVIGAALGRDPATVKLGFGHGQFDVRPF